MMLAVLDQEKKKKDIALNIQNELMNFILSLSNKKGHKKYIM